jgi:hypothetical protein
MSPKVLETWINETLQDAEHLDIPGVILKPEQKLPIQRYQIDRQELQKQGIPADEVNRVYRGLFVYSVGFYELLNKCLDSAGVLLPDGLPHADSRDLVGASEGDGAPRSEVPGEVRPAGQQRKDHQVEHGDPAEVLGDLGEGAHERKANASQT